MQPNRTVTVNTAQRLAVSVLIIECENLTASGTIDVEREIALRKSVACVVAAFKIEPKHKRASELPDEFPDDHFKKLAPDRTTLRIVGRLLDSKSSSTRSPPAIRDRRPKRQRGVNVMRRNEIVQPTCLCMKTIHKFKPEHRGIALSNPDQYGVVDVQWQHMKKHTLMAGRYIEPVKSWASPP